MTSYLKAKLFSLARPATLRALYLLVVIIALALAVGAPDAWGSAGPGAGG